MFPILNEKKNFKGQKVLIDDLSYIKLLTNLVYRTARVAIKFLFSVFGSADHRSDVHPNAFGLVSVSVKFSRCKIIMPIIVEVTKRSNEVFPSLKI